MKSIKKYSIVVMLALSLMILSSSVAEAKVVKKSGIYGATLATKKDKYSENAYIKKVKLKKNKVITYGCFYFGKHIWSNKYLKVKKRTFERVALDKTTDLPV